MKASCSSFLLHALWIAALLFGTACSGGEEGDSNGGDTSAVVAKLAQADKLDGQEDKVVHKCAACNLGMDGSEELALEVHGYTMHFCSTGCRKKYESDADAKILALKVDG